MNFLKLQIFFSVYWKFYFETGKNNEIHLELKMFKFKKILWKLWFRWFFIISKQFFRQSINHFALQNASKVFPFWYFAFYIDAMVFLQTDMTKKAKNNNQVILAKFRQYSNGNYAWQVICIHFSLKFRQNTREVKKEQHWMEIMGWRSSALAEYTIWSTHFFPMEKPNEAILIKLITYIQRRFISCRMSFCSYHRNKNKKKIPSNKRE